MGKLYVCFPTSPAVNVSSINIVRCDLEWYFLSSSTYYTLLYIFYSMDHLVVDEVATQFLHQEL
jgi:hypothetical protein